MRVAMDPFRLLLISLAGWLNQRQQEALDYLQEENRVLREQTEAETVYICPGYQNSVCKRPEV